MRDIMVPTQGLNKEATAEKHGKEQVRKWGRRGWEMTSRERKKPKG
jgi:bisphosphoglycerate-dependent phosphoglycerate mutase